jgi:hypothetical protein
MPFLTRRRFFIGLILFGFLCGAWLFWQRFTRVALDTYVPETALGYVEVNDLPHLLNQFAATDAWRQLAPLYGVQNKLQYAGWANWLGRWTGIGTKESLLIARGQFALVVSGIEVRGDEVKPRLALLIETHRSDATVKSLMRARLPELANRVFKSPVQEASEYSGVPITIYRAPNTDRQILSANIGSTWWIANDAATLQSCIDVRQGRVGALAKNPLLAQAKAEVVRDGAVFAFVSNAGASRLSQFFTHLLIGKSLAGTPLAGMPEGIVSEISENTVEAMAYSASFASGGVLDRYAIVCKPEVTNSLQETIRIPQGVVPEQSEGVRLVPATAQDVTLINVADPGQALDGVERIVSGHLGVAQSFMFHKFFTTARKTFLGLEPGENPSAAIGSEVVRFTLATENSDTTERLWLIAARNRQKLTQLAERLLGTALTREQYQGTALTRNENRAFAFVGNYLAFGSPQNVKRLLDELGKTKALIATPQFVAAVRPQATENSVMHGFSSVSADVQEMMTTLAQRLNGNPQAKAVSELERLPLAATVTSLTTRGVVRESRSPVGNFPLIVNFVDSVF